MIGQKFHRLTVIERAESTPGNRGKRWLCQCECGNQTIARNDLLKSGRFKSCGCYRNEKSSVRIKLINTTHGMSNSVEYKTWVQMILRCNNKNNNSYNNYGGRGIKVCDRWINSFENFYEDMGKRLDGMSIDRIDVNGDYCPENCRWASMKIQSNNKRSNKYIKYNGETKTLSEWAEYFNMSKQKLWQRLIRDNLSFEEAILHNDRRYKEVEV